ncbi:hypothetical protein LCGC14_1248090 [marine sediment metagenome]|uniref:Uncharacterized protein n=1 Tax=marine sediment metagenome TaxID=412755 RepID=A0A0F9NL53_9ZZZZ
MAAPITPLFPDKEARRRMVVATTTITAGAGVVKTITIPAAYPPIDLNIVSPVFAIMIAQNEGTLVADGSGVYAIGGQMSTAPDSAGEFLITGARTINIWKLANKTAVVLVCYVSKGSGQKT